MADGTRTHDDQNHNPGLYQLSYSHRRERRIIASAAPASRARARVQRARPRARARRGATASIVDLEARLQRVVVGLRLGVGPGLRVLAPARFAGSAATGSRPQHLGDPHDRVALRRRDRRRPSPAAWSASAPSAPPRAPAAAGRAAARATRPACAGRAASRRCLRGRGELLAPAFFASAAACSRRRCSRTCVLHLGQRQLARRRVLRRRGRRQLVRRRSRSPRCCACSAHRVVREQRLEELRRWPAAPVAPGAGVRCTCRRSDLELQLVGRRLQAVGLLVDRCR